MSQSLLVCETVCRACLEPISEKNYPLTGRLVFDTQIDVVSMIEFCSSSEINLSDDLPDSLCVSCFKILRISYKFLKQFKENQTKLLELKEKRLELASEAEPGLENEIKENVHQSKHERKDDDILSFQNYTEQRVDSFINSSIEVHYERSEGEVEHIQGIEINNSENVELNENEYSDEFLVQYFCPICNRRFSNARLFYCHINKYNVSEIMCPKCPNNEAFNKVDYYQHYLDEHKNQCFKCNKKMSSTYGLIYHMKAHDNLKNFKCSIEDCAKSFRTRPHLRQHIQSHFTKNAFHCNLCSATFNAKDSLKYHLKVHSGQKDHLCSICGKAFYLSITLREHMYRHMNYKTFVCDICGKRFIKNSFLKRHLRHCLRKHNEVESHSTTEEHVMYDENELNVD